MSKKALLDPSVGPTCSTLQKARSSMGFRNEAVEELDKQVFGDFGPENPFETVVGERIDEHLVAVRTIDRF